jgi:hypothetical protein
MVDNLLVVLPLVITFTVTASDFLLSDSQKTSIHNFFYQVWNSLVDQTKIPALVRERRYVQSLTLHQIVLFILTLAAYILIKNMIEYGPYRLMMNVISYEFTPLTWVGIVTVFAVISSYVITFYAETVRNFMLLSVIPIVIFTTVQIFLYREMENDVSVPKADLVFLVVGLFIMVVPALLAYSAMVLLKVGEFLVRRIVEYPKIAVLLSLLTSLTGILKSFF